MDRVYKDLPIGGEDMFARRTDFVFDNCIVFLRNRPVKSIHSLSYFGITM